MSPTSRPSTDAATSRRMAAIRQRDTAPELAVRRALTRLGVRYRVHNRDLPGSPDVANRARRWAAYVHGCYWHRHPGCPRATTPKRNREWWEAKFAGNVERDARKAAQLAALGYRVVTVWECETARPTGVLDALLRERLGDVLPPPRVSNDGAAVSRTRAPSAPPSPRSRSRRGG